MKFQADDSKNWFLLYNLENNFGSLFYDIEKCFESLWLDDCIDALYENGIKDDILDLVFEMNQNAEILVKTPFGNTKPIFMENLVRQGTAMGPVLNNRSLDRVCHEGQSYQNSVSQLKPFEFIDDIADASNCLYEAKGSNNITDRIQQQKKLTFAVQKCKLLKIQCKNYRDNMFEIKTKH